MNHLLHHHNQEKWAELKPEPLTCLMPTLRAQSNHNVLCQPLNRSLSYICTRRQQKCGYFNFLILPFELPPLLKHNVNMTGNHVYVLVCLHVSAQTGCMWKYVPLELNILLLFISLQKYWHGL